MSNTSPTTRTLAGFLLQHDRRLYPITGDGNCYFRAISFILFGTEDNHLEVRTLLARFVGLNGKLFEKRLVPEVNESTVQKHVMKLCRSSQWATHIEVFATATLFEVPVYYCTHAQVPTGRCYRWEVFEPLKPTNVMIQHPDVILPGAPHHFEISYLQNCHYDCVVSADTGKMCDSPPPLSGSTHSLDLTE